ncbi:MAG TPA: RusA family crossover junction endodeoxyribonuclease [Chloroflexia bacterium]|nr:RusA family crossover junction endodeoxyribonuclease [Chloroflexia bacterium]
MAKKQPVPALQLNVPLPPSINAQYATVNGRRILSEEARKWKREVERRIERLEDEGVLTDQMKSDFNRLYLSVFLDFYFTSPHKRDLDGGLKITLDALCEALNVNDNRVVDIHLIKKIDPLHPRLEVSIEGVADWQFDTEYVYLDAETSKGEDK